MAVGTSLGPGRARGASALTVSLTAVVVGLLCVGCGRAGGPYRRADAPATGARGRLAAPSARTADTADGQTPPIRARAAKKGRVSECGARGIDETLEVEDPTAVGGQRSIWVHRPPGPDRADIPVLYLLHGSTTTELTLQQHDIGPILDAEMCHTGVPFVIAAPDGRAADGSDTEWADADDHRFQIETFVTERAIAEVEGDHPRSPQLRAIGGVSMGGFGAAAIALRHPDLYRQVACFAGYFHTDDRSRLFVAHDADHAPDVLIHRPGVSRLRWFLVEGAEDHDPLMQGTIGGEADRFAGLLKQAGSTYQVRHPSGGHDFGTWLPLFPAAADFLTVGWTTG